jgi:hypothetical protein
MLKLLITAAIVVFIAMLMDVASLHYQATVGKLPWKLKLFPDIGGYL